MSEEGDSARSYLMTSGPIWKHILLFSLPLLFGNLLQQLYNTADSVIVGNLVGSNALAAVGSSTSIINLLIAFSLGLGTGASVIIAQYLGAREKDSTHKAVHTALALSLLLGLLLTVIGVISTPSLLIWMQTPGEVFSDAVIYMQIYSAGMVFNVVYNMVAGIMNAAGNSRRTLIYLAYASVMNIILDLIFVGVFRMGVAGAAIATDISQLLSCVLAIRFLMRIKADYRVAIRAVGISKDMASPIISLGIPAGIQNMVMSLSNALVQSCINSFGAAVMAGYGAASKVDGFVVLPILSFALAATTFTGQNYGARNRERVIKGTWTTVAIGIVYSLVIGGLMTLLAYPIIRLFSADEEVVGYGVLAMKYFCPFYFLLAIIHILAGTIRGAGRTLPPMIILLSSLCVFRILWVLLVIPGRNTIEMVFSVYPASWALGAILMLMYTCLSKWSRC